MKLLDFVVIGGEKCGSTFLRSVLAAHPEIFMPKEEIPFFADPDFKQSKVSDLEKLFPPQDSEKLLGLYRSDYLYHKEAPKRLRTMIPEVKVIVIVRDPIERLLSSYFHDISFGFMPPIPPEEGIPLLFSGALTKNYPRSWQILEYGYFYKYLLFYLKQLPKKNVLILHFSDLKSDPANFIKTAYRFLGVNTGFKLAKSDLDFHPAAAVYSIPRAKFRALGNRFWLTYNRERTRVFPKRNRSIVDRGMTTLMDIIDERLLVHLFPNQKPKLSPDLTRRLERYYERDQLALRRLTDREI